MNRQNERIVALRPHHGMCLAYFEGKGYSEKFTENMQRILDFLLRTGVRIQLVKDADEICAPCIHNLKGICREHLRVSEFDRKVLTLCSLEYGQILPFRTFAACVQTSILSAGKMNQVCSGCQWEAICQKGKSRWRFLF